MKAAITIKFQDTRLINKSFRVSKISSALRKCAQVAESAESLNLPISYVVVTLL